MIFKYVLCVFIKDQLSQNLTLPLNNELIVQGSLVSNYSLVMDQISTTSNKPTNRGEFKEVISQIYRFIPNFTQSICKELEE